MGFMTILCDQLDANPLIAEHSQAALRRIKIAGYRRRGV